MAPTTTGARSWLCFPCGAPNECQPQSPHSRIRTERRSGRCVGARPIALTHYNERMTLVLRIPAVWPVDRLLGRPLDVSHFLRSRSLRGALRKCMSEALSIRHQADNILLDAASGGVWLTGCALLASAARAAIARAPESIAARSPIWRRTDGRNEPARSTPAATSTPSASRSTRCSQAHCVYRGRSHGVVHCHIARKPVPPSERLETIPPQFRPHPEAARQDRRGALPDRGRLERDLRVALLHGKLSTESTPSRWATGHSRPALIPQKLSARARDRYLARCFGPRRHQRPARAGAALRLFRHRQVRRRHELHKALVPLRGFSPPQVRSYKRTSPMRSWRKRLDPDPRF